MRTLLECLLMPLQVTLQSIQVCYTCLLTTFYHKQINFKILVAWNSVKYDDELLILCN